MSERRHDLVFDVGMHQGEDSDHYLSRGYRVVAVEASPDLCARARAHFARELSVGSLVIEQVAVSACDGPVVFHSNPNSTWGTTFPAWAERNAFLGYESDGQVVVDGVPFRTLMEKHGVPHYLKIDVEGADLLCLQGLLGLEDKPRYVSIESDKQSWASLLEELDTLESLGYTRFKAVAQHNIGRTDLLGGILWTRTSPAFPAGSSGPFGEETPGRWLTRAQLQRRYRFIFFRYRMIGDYGVLFLGARRSHGLRRFLQMVPARVCRMLLGLPGWYDTHARHAH